MRRGVLGIVIVLSALLEVVGYTSHAPASALSLFGFEVNLAGPLQAKTPTKLKTSNDNQINEAKDANAMQNNNCARYTASAYEACIAYVFDASFADAIPYYQYIKSSNSALANFVSDRIKTEYSGQAIDALKARVAGWPQGNMEVSTPNIKVLSLSSDVTSNTAYISTQETWRVETEAGRNLFQETKAHHVITLQHVQGQPTDDWVVVSIQ